MKLTYPLSFQNRFPKREKDTGDKYLLEMILAPFRRRSFQGEANHKINKLMWIQTKIKQIKHNEYVLQETFVLCDVSCVYITTAKHVYYPTNIDLNIYLHFML